MTKPHHTKRAPVVYKTPGRECAHAGSGCCPACFDPMQALVQPARIPTTGTAHQ